MLRVLVIGGGIHGVHVASELRARAPGKVDVRIIDPERSLLARWRQRASATGMHFLRSTLVHHIGSSARALWDFARARGTPASEFGPPYQHPSLRLFQAHCVNVVEQGQLSSLHVRGRVHGLSLGAQHALARSTEGVFEADYVVAAIGGMEEPAWPDWAVDARRSGAPVFHVFDRAFSRSALRKFRTILVVGGGITGLQTALSLVNRGHQVHLLSRHAPRVQPFDSLSGWMGPRFLNETWRHADWTERRRLIVSGRTRGSAPIETVREFRRAVDGLRVRHLLASDYEVKPHDSGLTVVPASGDAFDVDCILLATGSSSERPGRDWLNSTTSDADLPVAPCGYPIVDGHLRWHPLLFVTGPLAELELGPVSRSVLGARTAAKRIIPALLS